MTLLVSIVCQYMFACDGKDKVSDIVSKYCVSIYVCM